MRVFVTNEPDGLEGGMVAGEPIARRKVSLMADRPTITLRNRAALRDWLARNHATSQTIWLVRYKHPHAAQLPYPDMVAAVTC